MNEMLISTLKIKAPKPNANNYPLKMLKSDVARTTRNGASETNLDLLQTIIQSLSKFVSQF